MAWCLQARSCFLKQCWLSSMTLYGSIRGHHRDHLVPSQWGVLKQNDHCIRKKNHWLMITLEVLNCLIKQVYKPAWYIFITVKVWWWQIYLFHVCVELLSTLWTTIIDFTSNDLCVLSKVMATGNWLNMKPFPYRYRNCCSQEKTFILKVFSCEQRFL